MGRGVNRGLGAKPSLEVNLSRGTNPGHEVRQGRRVIPGRGASPGHGARAWPQSPSRALMGPWPGTVVTPSALVRLCLGREGTFGVRMFWGDAGLATFSRRFLSGPQQLRRRKMTGVSPAIKPGLPAQAVVLANEGTCLNAEFCYGLGLAC